MGRLVADFRCTACHEMELAGVPREIAKEVSGHKSDSQYQRYADLFDATQKVERQLAGHARRHDFMEPVAGSDKTSRNLIGWETVCEREEIPSSWGRRGIDSAGNCRNACVYF